jgi:hypothetical protein
MSNKVWVLWVPVTLPEKFRMRFLSVCIWRFEPALIDVRWQKTI